MEPVTAAKDIPDATFLEVVRRYNDGEVPQTLPPVMGLTFPAKRWALVWDVEAAIEAPPKVLRAKADKLIRRGLLGGCACGCRGDYELTAAGRAFLRDSR